MLDSTGRAPRAKMTKKTPKRSTRPARRPRRTHVRILFTCIGRRIELVRAFQRAAEALDVRLTIHGADLNWLAPAMHRVDQAHLVPRVGVKGHIAALLKVVRAHKIDLVIPLIDSDLLALAHAVPRFERAGARVLISAESTVRTCRDKLLTFQALSEAGVDTPDTCLWAEALTRKRHRFPYFMKPREGSAGMGNYRIDTLDELKVLGRRVRDPIVQEFVEGVEHTLDVYTGLDGRPRCVVPRRRLEVRTGEVSKGQIVKDQAIIDTGFRVAEVLGECRGVITVQCMVTPRGRIRVIEINPRFGGGAPLSIHAGADFPKWLLAELLGRRIRINPMGYKDGVTMLRYDDSVFVTQAKGRQRRPSAG